MTEDEWLFCKNPRHMIGPLFRKQALLYCGLVRQLWNYLTPSSQILISDIEDYVDGVVDFLPVGHSVWQEFDARRKNWEDQFYTMPVDSGSSNLLRTITAELITKIDIARLPLRVDIKYIKERIWDAFAELWASSEVEIGNAAYDSLRQRTDPSNIDIVMRDVMHRGLGRTEFDPNWRSSEVMELTNVIYYQREFHRMDELAILLENAGCRDATILEHCRCQRQHVKGCWLTDVILGKIVFLREDGLALRGRANSDLDDLALTDLGISHRALSSVGCRLLREVWEKLSPLCRQVIEGMEEYINARSKIVDLRTLLHAVQNESRRLWDQVSDPNQGKDLSSLCLAAELHDITFRLCEFSDDENYYFVELQRMVDSLADIVPEERICKILRDFFGSDLVSRR